MLFRNEEQTIRENLVKSDLVECVIGIGKNLFFNSPMEACILICRSKKSVERRGKILFINAKDEVTRKNTFSYLEDKHIKKIAKSYNEYVDVEGFAKVATIPEIQKNGSKLSIPLYVLNQSSIPEEDELSFEEQYAEWNDSSERARSELDKVLALVENTKE